MTTLGETTFVMPADAARHCREVARRRARNFYYGLKLLPEPKRSAIYAIYAWMRSADDIADGGSDGHGDGRARRLERLDEFARRTTQLVVGAPQHRSAAAAPMWTALEHVVAHYQLGLQPFEAMLQGQRDDLDARRYETFAELLEYCRRVASSVGRICIDVWGYDDERAPALAAHRGVAFQLTNIIRDFAEDLDEGRVYLPAEDFRRHGLTPRLLRDWTNPEACASFVAMQIARARDYYDRSAALDDMIEESCRPTLWAMTSIYSELLEKIAANPQRIASGKRLRLRSVRKAAIAVRARWMLRGASA